MTNNPLNSANNIISLSHVTAGYDKTPVLQDISFDIAEGHCVSLLGSNGCGKTTLLRTIAGMLPFSGDIHINGKSINAMKRKEIASYVAFLSQISSVYFSYSVYETVMQGRYLHKGLFFEKNRSDREIVDETLESLGLSQIAGKQITALSGGQLQRVMLARCIAQRCPILMLDEPMNHLDLKIQAEFMEYLANWRTTTLTMPDNKAYKPTVIGVFHDLNTAAGIADDIAFLKDGRLVLFAPKKGALTAERLSEVFDFDVVSYIKSHNYEFT